MIIHLHPHDSYKNLIKEKKDSDVFTFKVPGMDEKDYNVNIVHFINGTYKLDLNVTKAGLLKGG